MSTTPDCRCGHPSHYHGGGERPWPCGKCDCLNWRPTPSEVAKRVADLLEDYAAQCSSSPASVAGLALAHLDNPGGRR